MKRKSRAEQKSFLYRLFNDVTFKPFVVVNDILAAVTLLTVLALVLETVPALTPYSGTFLIIEYGAVIIFTIEYVLRIFAAERLFRYTFSFFGIIDLLAILPTYLGLANLTALKSARMLRILRFLRVLRLAKLSRKLTLKKTDDLETLYWANIKIYGATFVTFLILVGTAVYLIEGAHANAFRSIPEGMLWGLQTIIDPSAAIKPETAGGTVVRIVARLGSLILFAFLIHILGNLVNHLLLGTKLIKKERALEGERA